MTKHIVPPPDLPDKQPFVYYPLDILEQSYVELIARQNRVEEEREQQAREDFRICEGNLRNLLAGLFGSALDAYRPLPLFVYTLHNRVKGDSPHLCCELDGLRFAVSLNPFYSTSLSLLMPCGDQWQIATDETPLLTLADVAQVIEDWYDIMAAYKGTYGGEE